MSRPDEDRPLPVDGAGGRPEAEDHLAPVDGAGGGSEAARSSDAGVLDSGSREGDSAETPGVWGVLAEFRSAEDLLLAAEQVRDAGFRKWDAHTPFPVHGLNDAMGIRSTRLPFLVLAGGLTGGGLALLMQWWMNAVNYRYMVSGKPYFALPPSIPVFFELTVLFAALGAFLGMLAMNLLPQYYHPLFRSDRFRRATQDRFFISIEADNAGFHLDRVREFLECLGSTHVEKIEEEPE